jgi:hypothetical protein
VGLSSAYAGYEIIITRLYLYGILGALGKRYSLRLRNYGCQDRIIQGFVGGKTVKASKANHQFIDPLKIMVKLQLKRPTFYKR